MRHCDQHRKCAALWRDAARERAAAAGAPRRARGAHAVRAAGRRRMARAQAPAGVDAVLAAHALVAGGRLDLQQHAAHGDRQQHMYM